MKGHIKSHHNKYHDMVALKQGNENAQNNMITSFSVVSKCKCNSMFKSVGSLLRMEAFLPRNIKVIIIKIIIIKLQVYAESFKSTSLDENNTS